jgi:hypothetical protein
MKKRNTPARTLLHAAIGRENAAKLPEELLRRFEAKVEGIQLPEKADERRKFLRVFNGISRNAHINTVTEALLSSIAHNAPSFVSDKSLELMESRLSETVKATELAQHSCRPDDYMRFLARNGFDLLGLLDSAGIFTNGRQVVFEDISAEKMAAGSEIIRLVNDGSEASLRHLMAILTYGIEQEWQKGAKPGDEGMEVFVQADLSSSIMAIWKDKKAAENALGKVYQDIENFDPDAFEAFGEKESGGSIQDVDQMIAHPNLLPYGIFLHENELLRFSRCFEKEIFTGYVLTEPEFFKRRRVGALVMSGHVMLLQPGSSKSTVQHEMQHMFDGMVGLRDDRISKEYRAMLAEIIFSQNHKEAWDRTCNRFAAGMITRLMARTADIDVYNKVAARIIMAVEDIIGMPALVKARISSKTMDAIVDASRKLLNESYRKACGLTYDEILEPFRKNG